MRTVRHLGLATLIFYGAEQLGVVIGWLLWRRQVNRSTRT